MRAGSITVAELIKNRPIPVRAQSCDEAATQPMVLEEPPVAVVETTVPSTHRRKAPRAKQFAKVAGLSVASAVLIASVAAASIINSRRQADMAVAARPVVEMSDQQALLPNLFTLGSAPERRVTTGLPAPNKGSASATVQNPAPKVPDYVPENKRVTGAQPAAQEEPINTELVRHYYVLLSNKPSQALGLLDGVLRQSDLSRFVDSWSQVQSIRVIDVQQRPDGALLAVVDMVLPDGGTARVQQLLRVTETTPQRITGAEIISAQRS